jgi:hypothetical protein
MALELFGSSHCRVLPLVRPTQRTTQPAARWVGSNLSGGGGRWRGR